MIRPLLLSALLAAPVLGADLTGSWAGWAYGASGGDMPIRFHFTEKGGAFDGTLDVPASHAFALELVEESRDGDAVRFVRINSKGTRFEYDATIDGGTLRGDCRTDEGPVYSFEVFHSPVVIKPMSEGSGPAFAGLYRGDDGASVIVQSWFWDDLWIQDRVTGAHRCLFRAADDEFVSGAIFGAATPPLTRYAFERDGTGAVRALTRTAPSGAAERLARTEFREEEVSFTSDGALLKGTLVMPAKTGKPVGAVVIVGGSDWTSRHSVRHFADTFASMGLAALAYDNRGYADSGGEALCSFAQTARDAAAAMDALAALPDITNDRIGLVGISRGAWPAPIAATSSDRCAFFVGIVAPAVSCETQERARRLLVLESLGVDDAGLALASRYLDLQFDYGATGANWDEYAAARAEVVERGWHEHLFGPETPDDPEWQWDRMNMRHDPAPVIRKLECPVLIVLGERDEKVDPDESAPIWKANLAEAPTDDWTVWIAPGANHALQLVPEKGVDVPIHRRLGDAPGVWPTIEAWLRERASEAR